MTYFINLTAHPERLYTMGLSMSIGGSTPPTPTVKAVHYWDAQGEHQDTFEDNKIPNYYYSGRTDIYKVVVDSGISLGNSCFLSCTNLSSITFNQNTIVASTCRMCTSLQEVTLNNTTRLEGWTFSGCTSLSSITIPDSVTLIGGYAFDGSGLEEVVLGSGLTQINQECFDGCSDLWNITCKAPTAPTLGTNVFRNVAESGELHVVSGATGYDTWLAALPEDWWIYYEQDNWNLELTTEEGVNVAYRFNCANGIVADSAFSGTAIYDVYTSDITEIGESAFEDSTIEQFHADGDETLETIGENAFKGCEYLTDVILPSTMESIGDGAFSGCSELSFIICGAETAPSIGTDTFAGVASEGELVLPEGADYSSWYAALPSGWYTLPEEYEEIPANFNQWEGYFDDNGSLIGEYDTSVDSVHFYFNTYYANNSTIGATVYNNINIDAGVLGQYDIVNNNGSAVLVLHSTGEVPEAGSQEEEKLNTLKAHLSISFTLVNGKLFVKYADGGSGIKNVYFGGNSSTEGYFVDSGIMETWT